MQVTEDFGHLFDKADPNYKTRNLVFYGGRGSGKTVTVADALLIRGLEQKITVLCCREFQNSISDSVIKTLEEEIDRIGLNEFYQVQANAIYGKNGTEFIFKGVKNNVQSIKSMAGLDYIWVEEAQTVSDKSWETLIPTLRKDCSQFLITFNPDQPSDPTYQRFVENKDDDTYAVKVNWDRNPWFPEVLRKEMLKLQSTDPAAYKHIYEGEFDNRRSGKIYAKQLATAREENRITFVPYDPAYEVFTAWDLGFGDATSIWWLQWVGLQLRWLEYYENSGEQLNHYANVINSKNYNYRKSGHFLPHDGAAGNIRGDSVSKQLDKMGLHNEVLSREQDITPGLELVKQVIAYSVFDKDKCKDGLHALGNYGYEWDDERKVFKGRPRHDWSSNGADAARYAARAAQIARKSVVNYSSEYYSAGYAGVFN